MSYAYECAACRWKDYEPGKCPQCGGRLKRYRSGAPPKEPGFGSAPPPFKRHYSHIHGKFLASWDEYHRANAEKGIVDVGCRPEMPHKNSRIQVRQ